MPDPLLLTSIDACADAIIARVGKRVVLGLPVGIGKPNHLVNALVRRAVADPTIRLTIFTALSLRRPRGRSDLERRFIEPFAQRVFGDYPELEYVRLLAAGTLPANIEVNEFFLEPGAWLGNSHLQQNYVSANYTHVARDLSERGLNVIAQWVAPPPAGKTAYSLSSNPDLLVDLFDYAEAQRARGVPCLVVGQTHRALPYMHGDALVEPSNFDLLLDDPASEYTLFAPPNMPIGTTDYSLALHVASLIKDGGTLQLGIGELGDAIVYALKLRHERSPIFKAVLESLGTTRDDLIALTGGTASFSKGLYGCTEMLVDGFIDLYRAGILKRAVYPHALLQDLLNKEAIATKPSEAMLTALAEAGLDKLDARSFAALQTAGVFRADVTYDGDRILCADGLQCTASLSDADNRAALALHCLGPELRNGVLVHGGFFFGPQAFYAALRSLGDEERSQFAMQRISFINDLHGSDYELKVAQRQHARFVNTTMMVTGLGAAVSDGLESGAVVSGVGGQYNFIAMAHALPQARSILCVRSTRISNGATRSNIVWNYGHITIPRHLRDLVVTEYGIADLRGRTDAEVVAALVEVMDSRFQTEFVATAKRHGKLPAAYQVPAHAQLNLPQRLIAALAPWRRQALFSELPFGSDFTADEVVIAKALRWLQGATASKPGRMKTLLTALLHGKSSDTMQPYLARLKLDAPASLALRLERRVVVLALQRVLAESTR